MQTFILSERPEHELFSHGLDLILDASEGTEPLQTVIMGDLLQALKAQAAGSESSKICARAARQLGQLELYEIPVFICPDHCALLPFAAVIGFNELYLSLQRSSRVLTF